MLGTGFAILTDKRVYFKGTCYVRDAKRFIKRTEERIVDVKDVTGTGFIHKNPFVLMIIAIIFAGLTALGLLTGLVSLATGFFNAGSFGGMFLYGILAGVFYFVYRSQKKSLFTVSFAGGEIAFEVSWLAENESQNFQRELRVAKDTYEESRDMRQPVAVASYTSGSKADELKKLSELFESNSISKDEYELLKKEVLE